MAPVTSGQIHRDNNKKQKIGISTDKTCPNQKQQSILQKLQDLKVWVNSISTSYQVGEFGQAESLSLSLTSSFDSQYYSRSQRFLDPFGYVCKPRIKVSAGKISTCPLQTHTQPSYSPKPTKHGLYHPFAGSVLTSL